MTLSFLRRWNEASGGDGACATCDSIASKHGTIGIYSGGSPYSPGVGSGTGGGIGIGGGVGGGVGGGGGSSLSSFERKIRDVTTKDGTLH